MEMAVVGGNYKYKNTSDPRYAKSIKEEDMSKYITTLADHPIVSRR